LKTDYSTYSDQQLLALLPGNDQEAFTELYNRYRDKLYGFAFGLSRSEEKSKDLVHDVFARLWEQRATLDGRTIFISYLYQMIRNFRIDQLRRLSKETLILAELSEEQASPPTNPEAALIYQEIREKIREAIQQLPSRQKEIYTLHREQGLPYAEIAKTLQLSVSTVENHFSRALGNIRSYLHLHYTETIFYGVLLGVAFSV